MIPPRENKTAAKHWKKAAQSVRFLYIFGVDPNLLMERKQKDWIWRFIISLPLTLKCLLNTPEFCHNVGVTSVKTRSRVFKPTSILLKTNVRNTAAFHLQSLQLELFFFFLNKNIALVNWVKLLTKEFRENAKDFLLKVWVGETTFPVSLIFSLNFEFVHLFTMYYYSKFLFITSKY